MADGAPDDGFPRPRRERLSFFLFKALAPRLARILSPDPPQRLRPWETVTVERPARALGSGGPGQRRTLRPLEGTWYPLPKGGAPRGAVLLLHPWFQWGRAYFHRRGRIEALRRAGYAVLTVDLPGFGGSGEAAGYYDRDAEDALHGLHRRAGDGVPLHVWGVSSGGYWLHPALVRWNGGEGPPSRPAGAPPVLGAMFEDVAIHLLEWSWRTAPWGRPFYRLFRALFRTSYRFLDLRRHAPRMGLASVAYVSGETDPGVRPEDSRELAERAGGRVWIVSGAGHLESIKKDGKGVRALALEVFAEAQAAEATRAAAPDGAAREASARA